MARAETLTKLPLDRWFQIIGVNPLHGNGVYVNAPTVCAQPWLQFPYQAADRVGREDVAQAIAQAEADIEHFLGYRLVPRWETDEWRPTVRPWRPELFNLSVTDVRGMAQTVQANWHHFISGGVRVQTPVAADSAIVYSDDDGDGYEEVATITPTVAAGQDPCELRVYLPVSNTMVLTGGEDQWEIRPISVSVSGTTATIRFRREQLVKPELQLDLVPPADDSHLRGVDGAVDGNFLTEVDVYRVYNDPQTQATFLWEPLGTGCTSCTGTGCEVCAYATQTGCLTVRGDPRLSILSYRPATWDADEEQFDSVAWAVQRQPEIVRLYYYAGLRDKNLACPTVTMDREWERTVAYYAAALLDRPVCECNNVHAWVEHWRRDLAIKGEEGLQISARDLDNPFGTRRGMVHASRRVTREDAAIGRAVLA